MPTPNYRGGTGGEVIDEDVTINNDGADEVRIVLEVDHDSLSSVFNGYRPNTTTGAAFGYPGTILRRKGQRASGQWPQIYLIFQGLASTLRSQKDIIDRSFSIGEMAVSLSTDNPDDGTIQCNYLGATHTTRWLKEGAKPPNKAKYPVLVAADDVNLLSIYNRFPDNFTGQLLVKAVAGLQQMSSIDLTGGKGPHLVIETWFVRLESSTPFGATTGE